MDISLGRVMMTSGVQAQLKMRVTNEMWLVKCVSRHMKGDWGLVDDHDRAVNNSAAERRGRVLSKYPLGPDVLTQFIYVITEGDRQRTTILLPDEY